jgi:hypothetical protein
MITLKNRNEVKARPAVAEGPLQQGMLVFFNMEGAPGTLPTVAAWNADMVGHEAEAQLGIVLFIPNDNDVTDFAVSNWDEALTAATSRGTLDIPTGAAVLVVSGGPVIGYPKAMVGEGLNQVNLYTRFDSTTALPGSGAPEEGAPHGRVHAIAGGEVVIDFYAV